ncbi:MAG: thiamine-phosphate synthase family protein [Promethearchaeota archaeon]
MENNKSTRLNDSKERIDVVNQIKEIYKFIQQKKFVRLIPEVRTNIAGALSKAQDKNDVAGIDGRITIVNALPKAAGEIKFGVAEHTARLILSAKKFDNSVNFVMNLRYSPELVKDIQENTDLELIEINREKQPEEIKQKEFSSMQWLIKDSIERKGKISDIIWDKGSIGKEPMIRLFGKNSTDIITKLEKIFKLINID